MPVMHLHACALPHRVRLEQRVRLSWRMQAVRIAPRRHASEDPPAHQPGRGALAVLQAEQEHQPWHVMLTDACEQMVGAQNRRVSSTGGPLPSMGNLSLGSKPSAWPALAEVDWAQHEWGQ